MMKQTPHPDLREVSAASGQEEKAMGREKANIDPAWPELGLRMVRFMKLNYLKILQFSILLLLPAIYIVCITAFLGTPWAK
jgi:hypothetical protein